MIILELGVFIMAKNKDEALENEVLEKLLAETTIADV